MSLCCATNSSASAGESQAIFQAMAHCAVRTVGHGQAVTAPAVRASGRVGQAHAQLPQPDGDHCLAHGGRLTFRHPLPISPASGSASIGPALLAAEILLDVDDLLRRRRRLAIGGIHRVPAATREDLRHEAGARLVRERQLVDHPVRDAAHVGHRRWSRPRPAHPATGCRRTPSAPWPPTRRPPRAPAAPGRRRPPPHRRRGGRRCRTRRPAWRA